MKLLLVSLNFYPELTGIGRYNADMVDWLCAQGHEVRVVCPAPHYPLWRVFPGYRADRYVSETVFSARVLRCPIFVPSKPKGITRIFHALTFALSSAPILLWQALAWRPDWIFVTEPPLAATPFVVMGSRLSGAKSWIHVQDFEVDAAFGLGFLSGRRLRAFITGLERWLLRRFDRVTTISQRMREGLVGKGVDHVPIGLFPNWVDFSAIAPQELPSSYRQTLGIPPSACVCLYSGSLGAKQGIEIVLQAFLRLPADIGCHLVICGDGPAKAGLESQARGQDRVHLLPLQPAAQVSELMALADIQVLPQKTEAQDLVMPSKLPVMMASGRAVVACAGEGSEIASVLDGVGLRVNPGDVEGLRCAIECLVTDPERRRVLGRLGRERAASLWDRQRILSSQFRGNE